MSETITGVALLAKDGRMWALPAPARHCHLFALAAFQGVDAEPCEQGFVTKSGRFVNRSDAYLIARPAGQCNKSADKRLYSEDLW